MGETGIQHRARRAFERQLEYQQRKAVHLRGTERGIMASMERHSAEVRAKLEAIRPIAPDSKILEVGSGAHGLIFFFGDEQRIGVDPLADHYRDLFPAWQGKAETIAAFGERLPFEDGRFDLVLSDNVVDHAESPRRIVEEMVRVLKPGGLLYFTVHVHHPLYHAAATAHSKWVELGLPGEIAPFADHTVHLTVPRALALFGGLPLKLVSIGDTIEETRQAARGMAPRHLGDRLKRWFFKNAELEVIAEKTG